MISRGVNVFRANDPNLVHLFHTKHCDPELSPQQYDGCLKECFSIFVTKFLSPKSLLSPKSYKNVLKNLKKTKASHFGPSVYHYKLLKGKPTELERLMEAEVTN